MQRPDEVAQEIKNNPPQQVPLNDDAMSDDDNDIPDDIRSEAQSSAATQYLIEKLDKIRIKLAKRTQQEKQKDAELKQTREQLVTSITAERISAELARQEAARALQLQQAHEQDERARLAREAEVLRQQEVVRTQQVQRELELERQAHTAEEQARVRVQAALDATAVQVQGLTDMLAQFRSTVNGELQTLRTEVAAGDQRVTASAQTALASHATLPVGRRGNEAHQLVR